MDTELSYRFFNKLKDDQFSLIYMGEFDDEMTTTLMRINETSVNETKIFIKKISYFIVECFVQFRAVSSGDGHASISIANTKELYNELLTENILLIRKGDFSQKSILPLLTIIENNVNSGQNVQGIRKKIMYLLVEMLQNV